MTCGAKGKFVGPYISDPWAREQAKKECNGLCSVNGESCVVNFAIWTKPNGTGNTGWQVLVPNAVCGGVRNNRRMVNDADGRSGGYAFHDERLRGSRARSRARPFMNLPMAMAMRKFASNASRPTSSHSKNPISAKVNTRNKGNERFNGLTDAPCAACGSF